MKRKTICLFTVLLLLGGCASKPDTPTKEPSADPTIPAEVFALAINPMPVKRSEYTEIKDGVFVPFQTLDVQSGWGWGDFTLVVYSRESLGEERLAIELPVPEAETSVEIREYAYNGMPDPNGMVFGGKPASIDAQIGSADYSYDQFLCTKGFDWAHLAELSAVGRYYTELGDDVAAEAANRAVDVYYNAERQAYYDAPSSIVPVFYVDYLHVTIQTETDVELTTMTLLLDGERTELPIGKLSIFAAETYPYRENAPLQITGGSVGRFRCDSYYPDGIVVAQAVSLKAEANVSATRLWCENPAIEILAVHMYLTGPDGMTTDFLWDGESLLDLPAGSTIAMDLTVNHPLLTENHSTFSGSLCLEYLDAGERYGMDLSSLAVIWDRPAIAEYLECSEQVDMEAYYHDYYVFEYHEEDWGTQP